MRLAGAKKFVVVLVGSVVASCALFNKYQDAQHSVYAKTLSRAEENEINRNGEITKDILLQDSSGGRLVKGALRILKTDHSKVFNFVETAEWVNHGKVSGNIGTYHQPEFRDTTFYDNLGNSTYKVVYYKFGDKKYELGERWFSRRNPDSFIRHVEVFRNGVVSSEYEAKVIDFGTPKTDRQKKAVITMSKEYSSKGVLMSTRWYDDQGNLIREEK